MFETLAADRSSSVRKIAGPVSLLLHATAAGSLILAALWNAGDPGEPPVLLPPFSPPLPTEILSASRPQPLPRSNPGHSPGHPSGPAPEPSVSPRVLRPAPLTQDFTIGLNPSTSSAEPATSSRPGSRIGDGRPDAAPCPPACGDGPIDVGGDVVAPTPLFQPPPIYPEVLRRARTDGAVLLRAVIGLDGAVEELQAERADSPLFASAALAAVARWRYRPATLDGRRVRVRLDVAVNFRLQ